MDNTIKIRSEEEDDMQNIRYYKPVQLIGNGTCQDYYRCQVDVAWDKTGNASMGWVLKDKRNTIIYEDCKKFQGTNNSASRNYGDSDGVIGENIVHVWITSDCLAAILKIAGVLKTDP